MNNSWIQTLINFVVLLLLQEFLFNNIELGVYINIYVYVMFILLLPVSYSPLAILLLSGIMGLAVDVFSSGILGLNMATCLLIGYVRPYVLKMITTSSNTPQEIPLIGRTEVRKVLTYTVLLVLMHHFTLFLLESFSFAKLHFVLLRTIVSTICTVTIILVLEMLIARK